MGTAAFSRKIIGIVIGLALIALSGGSAVLGAGYNNGGYAGGNGPASSIGPAALGAYSGSVGISGNQGNGSDHLSNVNLNGEQNVASYAANPRSTSVTSVTATTVANSIVVNLSAAEGFIAHEGIAIYGAGVACSINSTACSGITVPAPTITQTGYTGANGGSTYTYQYEIAAMDAGYGITAASTASISVNGPTVLSEPNTANLSTTYDTGGNYNTLSGYGVTGASHYCIWRNTAGTGYQLWMVTDSTSFNDWSNHPTMGLTGPCGGNTPPSVTVADALVTSVVSVANGGTSLSVASAPSQSGTFTAWPDATAAFQAASNALLTNGGKVYVPLGYYRVRTISPVPGVYIYGAGGVPNGIQTDSIVAGTPGLDMFNFGTSNVSGFGFRDMVLKGGRNTFYTPNNGTNAPDITYVYLDNLTLSSEYANIEALSSIEEWYGKNNYFTGGWYGWDQVGAVFVNKSHLADSAFSGFSVNAIHWNTNTEVQIGITFDRTIIQSIKQDGVWIAGGVSGLEFNGLTDEGVGAEYTRSTTTATCTNSSDVVIVTSATGLAVGQDFTVQGCGSSNLPLTGTICEISGTSITLEDPTCTTARNAGTTQSTARPATNAIFDNMAFFPNGGQSSIQINQVVLANTGGCCGGTNTRYQLVDAGNALNIINSAAFNIYSPNSGTGVINAGSSEVAKPTPGAVNLPAGTLSFPYAAVAGGANYANAGSPLGGDIDLDLVDSSNNGLGTAGCFKVLQNDSGRNYIWETCGNISNANSATSLFRGSIENSSGVPLISNGTASIAGGGALATGSGAFAGTVTGAAATGNVVTPGMTCPNDVVAILGDETTAGGAKVTAKAATTFTFSATASDVVDYIASCR